MSTKYPEIFGALCAPFGPDEVKERAENGRTYRYITPRTARNRLDEVLGPEHWEEVTTPCLDGTGSYRCVLTITLPGGEEVCRTGVGGAVKLIRDEVRLPAAKDAASDAFKRAAEGFGVARYLYRDGVPRFAPEARAAGTDAPHPTPPAKPRGRWSGPPVDARAPRAESAPRTGKALFGWCKDREEELGAGLLKYLQGWAKLQEFPARMVEWSPDQVAEAHAEARRKLAEYQRSDAIQEAMAP